MRIGELADRLGVATDTIRFYERSGFLPRPARQRANNYRDYGEEDVEHLRLLIELRRLDVPLDDAARIASWCHSGHCRETTLELAPLIAARRSAIAERVAGLRTLDERLASLERHLQGRRGPRALFVLESGGAACCDAARAVTATSEGGCTCCAQS